MAVRSRPDGPPRMTEGRKKDREMQPQGFRDVFVPFSPDRQGTLTPAVAYGLSMAEALSAHVTLRLLGHRFDAPYSLAPQFVGSLVAPANAEEKKRMTKAEEALSAKLATASVTHDFASAQVSEAELVDLAAFQARLHGVSIVDNPESFFVAGRALVEELLFQTGRPLIVVPDGVEEYKARRVVVAWDGTARAARALNDALPILIAAEYVELLSVTDEKDLSRNVPGAEVAPHLSRYGIEVTVADVTGKDGDAGAAIRERATLVGADMIVMGAFAHSRWRQMVLGGVTDSMLRSAEIAVFLSH
jgi:nucleotide-binding universal stress UspA family protein